MFGDRFSSSTSCSRWVHETEPDRPDQSLTCCFLKVATHPADLVCLIVGVGNNTRTTQVGEFGRRRTLECSNQDCDPKTDSAHSRPSCLDQLY